jgi:hypothetical protein
MDLSSAGLIVDANNEARDDVWINVEYYGPARGAMVRQRWCSIPNQRPARGRAAVDSSTSIKCAREPMGRIPESAERRASHGQ